MEKVQFNSIDKKQNELKYSKNDKSSTLPRQIKFKMHSLINAILIWTRGYNSRWKLKF